VRDVAAPGFRLRRAAGPGGEAVPTSPLPGYCLHSRPTSSAEQSFATLPSVSPEEDFNNLRLSAACAQLNREQITELLAITGNLFEERKRIKRVLERLPESFGEVRSLLNELNRTVR
jgi:hypothetical protein